MLLFINTGVNGIRKKHRWLITKESVTICLAIFISTIIILNEGIGSNLSKLNEGFCDIHIPDKMSDATLALSMF